MSLNVSRSRFIAAAGAAGAAQVLAAAGAGRGARAAGSGGPALVEKPLRGGTAVWAEAPSFPPNIIFPFAPARYFGLRNTTEFQPLLFRPLYFFGKQGRPEVDYDISIGEPPRWSADGRTVTVTIKPWKWSNGETVDADGVMFWMHVFEAAKERHGAYVPGYFPDNLSSYRKLAPNEVSFTFDKAYSHQWVLMNQLSIIVPFPKAWDRTAAGPADATHDKAQARAVYDYLWERNLDQDHFIGSPLWSVVSGPWKLQRYSAEGHVTFVPNEHYSGPDKPYLDALEMVPSPSDDAEFEQLLRVGPDGPGGITVGYLPVDHIDRPTTSPLRGGPNPLAAHYEIVPQLIYGEHYFPINYNNPKVGPILRQAYFRQALQSVVDQDWAIREVYKGYGYRADGPVPALPDSPAISPRARTPRFPFDVERARTLLTEHGWDVSSTPAVCVDPAKAGPGIAKGAKLAVNLDYPNARPAVARVVERLKADAARAGIAITITMRDANAIVADAVPCKPSVPKPPCNWEMADWNGGWVYGPDYLPTGETQFATGAGVNFGSYSDPVADALIEKTVHGDSLSDFYAYEDYVADQLPVIFVPNFPLRLLAVAKNLRLGAINPYAILTPERWYYVRR